MPTQQKKNSKRLRDAELDYYFGKALKDPHTRIEFLRKKDRTKQGVMISCKHPEIIDHVIIGFSMCHLELDDFNKLENRVEKKNFGKMIAFKRAMKYSSLSSSIVHSIRFAVKRADRVYIPQTVHENLDAFIQSAYKYYKDCFFPAWVLKTYPMVEEETADPSDDSSTSSPSNDDAMDAQDLGTDPCTDPC